MRTDAHLTPSLRVACPTDLQAVRCLLRDCNLPDAGVEDQFCEAFIVAQVGDEIIGVAGIEKYGYHGLLRSVAVTESFRGRSVGRFVVNECLIRARRRGICEVYLLTTDAQRYFEALGFAAVDRTAVPQEVVQSREFASICPKTATVMVFRSQELSLLATGNLDSGERT